MAEAVRKPGRRLLWIGAACGLVGLVATAVVVGWAAGSRASAGSGGYLPGDSTTVALPLTGAESGDVMPDVRGQAADAAKQIVADAGIPVSSIEVVTREAAGPAGRVIEQTPAFGSLDPSSVMLVVSERATVPDVVGTDSSSAIGDLQGLGARVTTERRYVPGVEPGDVASVDPAAGEPLPEIVTVVVGDSAVTRPLGEIESPSDGGSSREDVVHEGVTHDTAVELRSSWSDESEYTWRLGGEATRVEAAVAASEIPDPSPYDDDPPSPGTHVVVRADGEVIDEFDVTSTEPRDVSWDVTDVDTLSITLTEIEEDGGIDVLLLDAVALGTYGDEGEEE